MWILACRNQRRVSFLLSENEEGERGRGLTMWRLERLEVMLEAPRMQATSMAMGRGESFKVAFGTGYVNIRETVLDRRSTSRNDVFRTFQHSPWVDQLSLTPDPEIGISYAMYTVCL